MHAFSRSMALVALLSGAAAYADRNDLRISQLGNPDEGEANFSATANSDFQAFARAMSAVMTSANLTPPETLGHAGFNVSAELSVVALPSSIRIPMEQTQPGSVLVPSLHVRKGLPFSVEFGGRVGWVERSRMLATTGELKWAVNEGFTYLPDIGVRGHVTRLMGVKDLSLTAVGLDAGIGKQFPLGGMITLTPYGGLDFTFVGAESDIIDFRPDRPYGESLLEDSRSALQDTAVYKQVEFASNMTQRIYGGVRFIGGVLQLGAEISFTRLGSSETDSLPTVVTFNTSLGLDF
jgi:hypothetical protein